MTMNDERLAWLKKHRRWECPKCKPQTFPYSLIRTTNWCPRCERVWRYRYLNPESSIKRALRYWAYDGEKGTIVK